MTGIQSIALVVGVGMTSVASTAAWLNASTIAKALAPSRTHFAIVCQGGAIWESVTREIPKPTGQSWVIRSASEQGPPQVFTVPQPASCITIVERAEKATADLVVWRPEREHASASLPVKPPPKAKK